MATIQRFLLFLAAALPFFSKLMPRGTLTSGDRRYNVEGDEIVLVHNYATTVPRQSLWSVVDYTNELRIVDFGPKGPRHRRSRKDGIVGRDAKRFTNAEWTELLRRSRGMSAVAPADFGVQRRSRDGCCRRGLGCWLGSRRWKRNRACGATRGALGSSAAAVRAGCGC